MATKEGPKGLIYLKLGAKGSLILAALAVSTIITLKGAEVTGLVTIQYPAFMESADPKATPEEDTGLAKTIDAAIAAHDTKQQKLLEAGLDEDQVEDVLGPVSQTVEEALAKQQQRSEGGNNDAAIALG